MVLFGDWRGKAQELRAESSTLSFDLIELGEILESGRKAQPFKFADEPAAKAATYIRGMGAAFLCAQSGIVERTLDNSAAYIDGWLSRLTKDARLVIHAAAQAQHAADFILAKSESASE